MFKLNSSAFASPVSSADYSELIATIAAKVVARRLAVPVVLFLESTKPLNRLVSQALLLFSPLIGLFVSYRSLDAFCDMLQDRTNLEKLIAAIETAENTYRHHETLTTDA